MKATLIVILSLFNLFFSCDTSTKKNQNKKTVFHIHKSQVDSLTTTNQLKETFNKHPKNIKSVMGYRFIITGDFDGDGKKENIIEHFFSGINNKETNKFYDSLSEEDQLVALTIKKKPISFVSSNNKLIDTLHISSGGQLLGLSYLKNEGDLNGDGTDEVSYVVNWADWSNLNTWHVVTYKNKKWNELYSFPIWDWQLPDLPETFNQHEIFGHEKIIIKTKNDTINKLIDKKLKDFKGLLKKVKTNKIQVIFRNNKAEEDTMIVDLERLK